MGLMDLPTARRGKDTRGLAWRAVPHFCFLLSALLHFRETQILHDWRENLVHDFEALVEPFELLWPKAFIKKVSILAGVEAAHGLVLRIVPGQRKPSPFSIAPFCFSSAANSSSACGPFI